MRTSTQSLLLTTTFLFSATFTLGLTYAPCYSTLCTEILFPLNTRLDIATYYLLLASIAFFLLLRAHIPACTRLSNFHSTKREVPIVRKRFTLGGVALTIWILFGVLATTAFQINPQVTYWTERTEAVGWAAAMINLVVTSIIGDHIAFIMGLLLIPVGRNSFLIRVFRLPYGTLLYVHKLLAYLVTVGTLAHALAYFSFWGQWARTATPPQRTAFDILNPTQTLGQSQARSAWSGAVLPTGIIAFILLLTIAFTALPTVRRQAYNFFYYTHILIAPLIIIGVSFHASLGSQFLLPGLLLWTIDLGWRFFAGESKLSKTVSATISSAGGGWYRIALPLPASASPARGGDEEKVTPAHPLQTYYINIPLISRAQNHAFTAAKVAADGSRATLLFQKVSQATVKRSASAQARECTWQLTRLLDEHKSFGKPLELDVRLEGPYSPVTNSFETANHVICIVGGTGLTGAYSLARWWYANRGHESNGSFTLVWTARQAEALQLEEWVELQGLCAVSGNMRLVGHCSSQGGRLDVTRVLEETLAKKDLRNEKSGGHAWVYASGPNGLLTTTADACIDMEAKLRRARKSGGQSGLKVASLSHDTADWEV